ncbi:MAG: hypothetical protein KBC27_00720 [Rickettsiales bacterium]|nr:hypothetical protein [Rickettsiales bacterium]
MPNETQELLYSMVVFSDYQALEEFLARPQNRGIDLNFEIEGTTLLHIAVHNRLNPLHFVGILLYYGANPLFMAYENERADQLARRVQYLDVNLQPDSQLCREVLELFNLFYRHNNPGLVVEVVDVIPEEPDSFSPVMRLDNSRENLGSTSFVAESGLWEVDEIN